MLGGPSGGWAPRSFVIAVALSLVAGACRDARTEVLIVIDTDLAVPSELDEVVVNVVGPSGEPRLSSGSLASEADLPAIVGIVDSSRDARTITVTVTGLRRGANVIQRRARLTMVPGETRALRVALLRSCVGIACQTAGHTCAENGCRTPDVDESELIEWNEDQRRRDGGVPDASDGSVTCMPSAERCDEIDDDCDGRTDEDFDLTRDMRHCGACGAACPETPANASSFCAASECQLRCDPGYDDCDGDVENGCETNLLNRTDCGACDRECSGATPFCSATTSGLDCVGGCPTGFVDCDGACVDVTSNPDRCGSCTRRCEAPANASSTCVESMCDIRCDEGFADCDGNAANGCESNLRELGNCGSCGRRCELEGAVASCATGTCELTTCIAGRGNCDGNAANGCEENLATNPQRCGACGNACVTSPSNGASACVNGMCRLECAPGYGNCDNNLQNGCETPLNTGSSCGGCGIACEGGALCALSATGYRCVNSCENTQRLCGASCVDTSSDPLNCNECGRACPSAPNSQAACTGGACQSACLTGYGNCDNQPSNGCEQSLSAVTDCGTCDNDCPTPPRTIARCTSSGCAWDCEPGWGNCNGMPGDGCEVDLRTSTAHCGACNAACMIGQRASAVACMASTCRVTQCSNPQFADCDGNAANGCETRVNSDIANCGRCGVTCGPTERCCSGTCADAC